MNSSSPKVLPARKLVSLSRFDLAIKYVYARAFLRWGDRLPVSIRRCYRDLVWATNGAIEPDRSKKGLAQFETQYRSLICSLQAEGYNPEFKPVTVCRDGRVEDGAHRVAACWALNIPVPALAKHTTCHACMSHSYLLSHGLWPDWLDACLVEVLGDLPVYLRVKHGDQVGTVGLSDGSMNGIPLVCVYKKTLPVNVKRLKVLEENPHFSGWSVQTDPIENYARGYKQTAARLATMVKVQVLEPAGHPYWALRDERQEGGFAHNEATLWLAETYKDLFEILSFTERFRSFPQDSVKASSLGLFIASPSCPLTAGERRVSRSRWVSTRAILLYVGLLGRIFRMIVPWRCEKWLARRVFKY